MALLTEKEIVEKLSTLRGWSRQGKEIRKTLELKDFVRSMGYVASVGLLAEKANHHPDIDIRWNTVTLTLSTHSEGGLTVKDFSLAAHIDDLEK
jgi:4a-hydroxytetrahydrobiopterin dehydratase